MEVQNQVVNDAPEVVNNTPSDESKKNDVVAYSTYSKVLGTLKKRESELDELRSRIDSIELEKKQAEGNKDEVITTLRSKLKEAEEGSKKLQHKYAWNVLEGQIKTEAIKQGCANPDKLIRLLSDDDLKAIEVDAGFNVNQDDLKRLIDKARKDNEDIGLFKNRSVNVNDVSPTKSPAPKQKKVEEMTPSELAEYIKKLE